MISKVNKFKGLYGSLLIWLSAACEVYGHFMRWHLVLEQLVNARALQAHSGRPRHDWVKKIGVVLTRSEIHIIKGATRDLGCSIHTKFTQEAARSVRLAEGRR